ncbi:MAG TPA: hypothetical protein VGI10_26855 [Polyangiaceae bacterium]
MIGRFEVACLLALCASVSACGPSVEEKAEAGTLNRAIQVLRNAPNPMKASSLAALAATRCERPELCTLRDRCADAYGLHVQGVEDEARAKQMLATDAAAATIDAVLDRARDELGRARPLVEKCADAQGDLQRRYKLQ